MISKYFYKHAAENVYMKKLLRRLYVKCDSEKIKSKKKICTLFTMLMPYSQYIYARTCFNDASFIIMNNVHNINSNHTWHIKKWFNSKKRICLSNARNGNMFVCENTFFLPYVNNIKHLSTIILLLKDCDICTKSLSRILSYNYKYATDIEIYCKNIDIKKSTSLNIIINKKLENIKIQTFTRKNENKITFIVHNKVKSISIKGFESDLLLTENNNIECIEYSSKSLVYMNNKYTTFKIASKNVIHSENLKLVEYGSIMNIKEYLKCIKFYPNILKLTFESIKINYDELFTILRMNYIHIKLVNCHISSCSIKNECILNTKNIEMINCEIDDIYNLICKISNAKIENLKLTFRGTEKISGELINILKNGELKIFFYDITLDFYIKFINIHLDSKIDTFIEPFPEIIKYLIENNDINESKNLFLIPNKITT